MVPLICLSCFNNRLLYFYLGRPRASRRNCRRRLPARHQGRRGVRVHRPQGRRQRNGQRAQETGRS